jgi:hypothetical protein
MHGITILVQQLSFYLIILKTVKYAKIKMCTCYSHNVCRYVFVDLHVMCPLLLSDFKQNGMKEQSSWKSIQWFSSYYTLTKFPQ